MENHFNMRTSARPLTKGEIALASLLFGNAIDYRRVRIHARRYMPFQPKNGCMTPDGSMYFHASCFLDDYSQANLSGQHWFMHEMVLLWQSAHHSVWSCRIVCFQCCTMHEWTRKLESV